MNVLCFRSGIILQHSVKKARGSWVRRNPAHSISRIWLTNCNKTRNDLAFVWINWQQLVYYVHIAGSDFYMYTVSSLVFVDQNSFVFSLILISKTLLQQNPPVFNWGCLLCCCQWYRNYSVLSLITYSWTDESAESCLCVFCRSWECWLIYNWTAMIYQCSATVILNVLVVFVSLSLHTW